MKELNKKVAIVTGTGQGIGNGIALNLAKRGVKVVCVGRRIEPLNEVVAEIKALNQEAIAVSCDVAERDQVKAVVDKTIEVFKAVDVVINNAQPIPASASVEDTTYENMLFAWRGGVIGSLNFMQEVFPYMKAQNEGRIINFASATGMFGYPNQLAYASNKEGVRGLTKIAAKEWAKYNITVNVVLPGAERPAAKEWAKKHPELYEEAIQAQPMKRLGDAEDDIGRVVAFLSGPDSKFLTGQSLLVDGGYSIMP